MPLATSLSKPSRSQGQTYNYYEADNLPENGFLSKEEIDYYDYAHNNPHFIDRYDACFSRLSDLDGYIPKGNFGKYGDCRKFP